VRFPVPPRTARLAVAVCLASCAALAARGLEADPQLRDADRAWARGDYPSALRGYLRLLDTPDADRLLPAIALQTGELFHTIELTGDGGAPQFSPDGRYIAYEVGRGAERHTRVAPAATPTAATAELPGHGASFAPDGTHLAYLRTTADALTPEVVVRRIAGGTEERIETGALRVTSVLAGRDQTVLLTASDAKGIDQIHLAGVDRRLVTLTNGLPSRFLHAINATGTAALFTERLQRPGTPPAFGIVSLPDGALTLVGGYSPAFSGDGESLAWVREGGGLVRVMAASTLAPAEATSVRAGPERVDLPALSHDGGRIAFQIMHRHDWELHVIERDGSGERRVTEEIQHDVMPRFLTSSRLLGLMGEPRHRRSYLYDLEADTRTRLFHNNTVRTIAPEYGWAASPDGRTLLVVADRDGDTVSPERGVYLMDLGRHVTAAALRARLSASLAAEEALRDRGRDVFEPIAERVRHTVDRTARARIEAYQEALFAFGSKHISQPGNRSAAGYLFTTYASFGYEPELQWFDAPGALDGRTANVIATLRGTRHPDLVYVVSSHYDSVAASPGADDNSSGTAVLLETARLLAAHPQPATIVFASFTGEESGLLGSREFVRRARAAGTHITGVLNNDTIGWSGNGRLDNTIRYASPGIRDIQHAAAIQFSNLITYDARYFRGTDAHAFYEGYGGIFGGIGSYPILANPNYHGPGDVLETIDHQLVTEVAKTTIASIVLLASSPAPVSHLRLLEVRAGHARLSWSPNREQDLAGYVVEWQNATGGPVRRLQVTEPSAELQAGAGSRISVRAVNASGLESWDEVSLVVP
jgi:Tol biopolymer transport system component